MAAAGWVVTVVLVAMVVLAELAWVVLVVVAVLVMGESVQEMVDPGTLRNH